MFTLPPASSGIGIEFGMLMLDDRFSWVLPVLEARFNSASEGMLDRLICVVWELTLGDRLGLSAEVTLVDRCSKAGASNTASFSNDVE